MRTSNSSARSSVRPPVRAPAAAGNGAVCRPLAAGKRTCSTTAASEEGTPCALLIETRAAIGNIEEVRKVKGIDCLTIAAFDLSAELGVSGHLDAPGLVEAITRAERVIGEAGNCTRRCGPDAGADI